MISVILIWIYILATTLVVGVALISIAKKTIGYSSERFLPVILAGLAGVTVYAEIFSLFAGVGKVCNIILLLICAGLSFVLKKELVGLYKNIVSFIKAHRIVFLLAVLLFLLMSYGTSHGLIHYDTGLYHAQSIRWIEEYGVVPGLGNLHTRLAYNSAAFCLNALYSFAFLGGNSYHVTAGFCALLLSWECLELVRVKNERCLSVSAFARFAAIYYLLMIFDEMISPASDYYMVCLAFILIIGFIDLVEKKEERSETYAMLALFAGYILTIKLSGAFLLLLAIYPVILFIRKKEIHKIFACIGGGGVIVLPYVIRNFILSGWFMYPSTALDFFKPDWQIPKDIALSDYKEIQVYGRGYTEISGYERPIYEWFGGWFASQSALDRLFILAAIGGVLCFVIKCLYYGFTIGRKRPDTKKTGYLFAEGILCICFLFWLFTSPLMRYGCLYVYLTAGVIWGRCILELVKNKKALYLLYVLLVLIGCYKSAMFVKETASAFRTDVFVTQQDYDNYPVYEYDLNGYDFYAPVEGDRVGYDAFPSSPWEVDVELRGEDIKDGFAAKQ